MSKFRQTTKFFTKAAIEEIGRNEKEIQIQDAGTTCMYTTEPGITN